MSTAGKANNRSPQTVGPSAHDRAMPATAASRLHADALRARAAKIRSAASRARVAAQAREVDEPHEVHLSAAADVIANTVEQHTADRQLIGVLESLLRNVERELRQGYSAPWNPL